MSHKDILPCVKRIPSQKVNYASTPDQEMVTFYPIVYVSDPSPSEKFVQRPCAHVVVNNKDEADDTSS